APMWMIVVSVRVASTAMGDLAPRSATTVCASTTKESDGAPLAGTAGTNTSVPRMIKDESRRNRGSVTRRMLRAEGTPPTARVESMGGGAGSTTKLWNGATRLIGVRATGTLSESTRMYHWRAAP